MFWIIKILATTVGETGGDALSMTLKLGYAVSSMIFFALFIAGGERGLVARVYNPLVPGFFLVRVCGVSLRLACARGKAERGSMIGETAKPGA
jgi:uncharacterized membrane-anchored protein